ncbi:hypothetical protein KKA14_00050, partial [bacterium]|nr:hypothetical protein [bacterium]
MLYFKKNLRISVKKMVFLITLFLMMSMIVGCAEKAFIKSKQQNTFEGYSQFLESHGDSEFAEEAMKLRDKKAFDAVKQKDTLEAYKLFLSDYADSEYADEAAYLKTNRMFIITNKISIYDTYLTEYPTGKFIHKIKEQKE